MRSAVRYGTVLLAGFTLGCGSSYGDDGGGNPPPPNTINVQNNNFNPATLTITSGTQVTFSWVAGSVGHNVLPSSANPLSAPSSGGGVLRSAPYTFAVTFNTAGTFRFYCDAHGEQNGAGDVSGMSGTITVQP